MVGFARCSREVDEGLQSATAAAAAAAAAANTRVCLR